MGLNVYLAGSIRDGVEEDFEWRERVIREVNVPGVHFLNPLAGKQHNLTTKAWTVCGIPSSAGLIVGHDFSAVDRSDLVLFNFLALSQGYANIGTLIEFGRATGRAPRCLIYSIVDPDYRGHENQAMFKLHPFIERNSVIVFPTVDPAIDFLRGFLPCLMGDHPHFGGFTL